MAAGLKLSNNLIARIVGALALLPPVVATVYWGGFWFGALLLIAAGTMAYEWNSVTRQQLKLTLTMIGLALSSLAVTAGVLLRELEGVQAALIVLGSLLMLIASLVVAILEAPRADAGPGRPNSFRWALAGFPYLLMAILSLAWLRSLDEHGFLVFWLFFSVWCTDVGGYFAGRGIGGPKLAPRISPSKTWAGLIGGVLLAGIGSVLFSLAVGWGNLVHVHLSAMVLACVAQAGDLFESYVKRRFDCKDSGSIIPGHGGLLDRVDGIVFAAPTAALTLAVIFLTNGGQAS